MTSKERVRAAMEKQKYDRVPAYFGATEIVQDRLIKKLKMKDKDELLDYFNIDIRTVDPELKNRKSVSKGTNGKNYTSIGLFGEVEEYIWNGSEYNRMIIQHPLNDAVSPADVDKMDWPDPAFLFDYDTVREKLDRYKGRASIFGHWGPFQTTTYLRSEDKLYMDMALNPELCHRMFERMHEFQMDHYKRVLEAGEGRIDILRTHDDYGTQISMLFSKDMWLEYFEKNTRELVDLAHNYGAYFQQHSCGAVAPIIPFLIDCGVDALEPLQPVQGLEPEILHEQYHNDLCFVGGIDTQHLLPFGTIEEVANEIRRYIEILAPDGGYILYPSQEWESVVPLETIEAFYNVSREYW